jgi:hypothetical protein
MKFACPESQKRVLLKCGSIDSGLGDSLAVGASEEAESCACAPAWDCADATGAANPSMKISNSAEMNEVRGPLIIMKINLNFNSMRTSQRLANPGATASAAPIGSFHLMDAISMMQCQPWDFDCFRK